MRRGVDSDDREGVGVKIGASLATLLLLLEEEDDGDSSGVGKTLQEIGWRGPREVDMMDKLSDGFGDRQEDASRTG